MKRVILMNSPVATVPGTYEFAPTTAEVVLDFLTGGNEVLSYIGHPATAEVMSVLLGVPIESNRGMYQHEVGDVVVIFRMLKRLPEGAVLNADEIAEIGYEFAFFNRIA